MFFMKYSNAYKTPGTELGTININPFPLGAALFELTH